MYLETRVMNILLSGALGTGWGSYVENLLHHPPPGATFFFQKSFIEHWQLKTLHLSGIPVSIVDFPLSSLFCNISPFSLLPKRLNYNIPNLRYLHTIDEIDLVQSICRLYRCRKPWILVFDTPKLLTIYRTYDKIPQFSKTIVRKFIISHNCKRILPFSEIARKELEKHFDVPADMVKVLPPGVQVPKLSSIVRNKHKNLVLLFVGRNFRRKGGFILLKAFEKLCSRFDDIHLIVKTGTRFPISILGRYYDKLKERVTWIDHQIPRNELNELYRCAEIFVFPTLEEPFGLVLLEAMSFGLPVIASNVYAIPEIVEDGKTGFLIPAGSSEELFKKVSCLIDSMSLRERMGREGRNRVERLFSNEVINWKLKEIYEESLRK
ncbi:MAG: glycosyltransferase family 4 protein [Leptospiraceae bacterium]|nr:glycosyltransferase family 4 protein [Leptospiraceae bacterium]